MSSSKAYISQIFQSTPVFWVLFGLCCIEVLSFAGSQFEVVNTSVFITVIVLTFIVSMKKLHYGILILFTELIIGSKGYLFALEISSFSLSIRLALFLVIFIAYLIWIVRDKSIAFFSWKFWKPYTAIIILIGLGVGIGLLRDNALSHIFLDTNGYLFFGIVGPMTQAMKNRQQVQQLIGIFILSSILLTIKTIVLLFLFSQIQILPYTLPEIYRWVRDTGVGEITRFPNGLSRIFFQSHVYNVILYLFCVVLFVYENRERSIVRSRSNYLLLAGIVLSGLIIFLSYSRSFWVATAGALCILAVWFLWRERIRFKRFILLACIIMCAFAFDYALALGIVNIPLPGHIGIDASSLLTERTKDITEEPAAASRWQLLDPLWSASLEHPVAGSGLGSTVTYKSEDPRVLEEHPDGMYTTFAFEWGYLDLLYKFGIIGVLCFGYFFYALCSAASKRVRNQQLRAETVALLAAVLVLLLIHVFTPYINHPLGIGWLVIVSLVLSIPNSQRDES